MDLRVLGPVEVWRDGAAIDVGSPKQRTVLALLAAAAPRPVSVDRLIEEVWDGAPPPRPLGSLQVYVSNLRRALEPARRPGAPATVLVTAPPGYALRVDELLDRVRFERAAARGHELLAAGANAEARGALTEALDMWRGDPYADVTVSGLAPETERLLRLRMLAAEDLWAAELALGRHRAAAPALRRLALEHPLRERLWELLALALYRSGHQAEALSALGEVRRRLADDLGIDPGPSLRTLETDILRQSPHLNPPRDPSPAPVRAAAPHPSPPPAFAPGPFGDPSPEPADLLVGRADALAALTAAAAAASAGHGRLVLISGEPGIGKTRLLREFLHPAPGEAALPAPAVPSLATPGQATSHRAASGHDATAPRSGGGAAGGHDTAELRAGGVAGGHDAAELRSGGGAVGGHDALELRAGAGGVGRHDAAGLRLGGGAAGGQDAAGLHAGGEGTGRDDAAGLWAGGRGVGRW
ncbi:AfsR/SARP family transcriptional regulator, partial [Actinocorallia aurea]